jgi:putative CocE/NonD family hydrolase
VEWCAAQPWCDGKVGTWGGSALGKQQFDTAAEQPPHLVCCAPLIAFQGNRYESYYEGGVLLESHVRTLDGLGFGVSEAATAVRTPDKPVWRIVRNQSYTPEKISVPCLLISGWWDNYPREILEQYHDLVTKGGESARKHTRLVMGPWSHTQIDVPKQGDLEFKAAEDYSTNITMRFFDYFLRGKTDNGYDKLPRVHAFQCHTGWVTGESWDKLAGKAQTRWLTIDGDIVTTEPRMAPEGAAPGRGFHYDPRQASPSIGGRNLPPMTHGPKNVTELERRKDVLVYATPELEAPLAVRGEVVLKVRVWCNRPDYDLHARLVDTNAKGESFLVSETILRAKLRDGKSVQPTRPAEGVELALRFAPHAYTWQKGHRLKLILTGGSTPRYERNSHTGADAWDEKTAQDADITLDHHGPKAVLELPVAAP